MSILLTPRERILIRTIVSLGQRATHARVLTVLTERHRGAGGGLEQARDRGQRGLQGVRPGARGGLHPRQLIDGLAVAALGVGGAADGQERAERG